LRQVVVNLLSNAAKFTASGGEVRVNLTRNETSAVLAVTDTGIGIHPSFLPHVFERFRQGSDDATTGLGLGLAIVKNLVELHGGTVVARSEGVGRGAEFIVTLPRIAH
jgi:signal transduction histidine kinase